MDDTLTYADLEMLLRHLGFTPVSSTGPQRVYENVPFGAVIVLPPFNGSATVRPQHLATVRRITIEKGVTEEDVFDCLVKDRLLTKA
jgi:hypothetical protein